MADTRVECMDNMRLELKRILIEGNYGVTLIRTPDVQGFMYAVYSKDDGSVMAGHWVCHNTPTVYLKELLTSLKNL